MTLSDRRARDQQERRQLIVATARKIAEREGWNAVTTRRLASEIEYSQPVIYKHFASLDQLTAAIALDGFTELASTLRHARLNATPQTQGEAAARAYLTFANENPAVYEAMFSRAAGLAFGATDAPEPLAAAFAEFAEATTAIAGRHDPETLAEVFWASLHGLVLLEKDERLPRQRAEQRLTLLFDLLT